MTPKRARQHSGTPLSSFDKTRECWEVHNYRPGSPSTVNSLLSAQAMKDCESNPLTTLLVTVPENSCASPTQPPRPEKTFI